MFPYGMNTQSNSCEVLLNTYLLKHLSASHITVNMPILSQNAMAVIKITGLISTVRFSILTIHLYTEWRLLCHIAFLSSQRQLWDMGKRKYFHRYCTISTNLTSLWAIGSLLTCGKKHENDDNTHGYRIWSMNDIYELQFIPTVCA